MPHESKLALAHDHLFQIGGAENVLYELAQLFPAAPIFTLVYSKRNLPMIDASRIRTSYLQHMPGGTRWFKWYLSLMPAAWERFDFSPFRTVLSSSSAFVKGIIVPPETTHVTYCHSPTRYLWSDSADYVRSLALPSLGKLALVRLLASLREWDLVAAKRVNHFIANSKFIAARIQKYYQRESTVIYPPVRAREYTPSSNIDAYYLMVCRLRPYKRVDVAIEAFNHLRLPLYVIGGGEELLRLKAMAKKNIHFFGEQPETVKRHYLQHCRAFIHPQEEDFGISAVEAMAAGRPVIAYRSGGAVETVIPGETGIFFTEQTWEALAYAVLTLDLDSFDPHRIHEYALRFDVSVFRERMISFMKSLGITTT